MVYVDKAKNRLGRMIVCHMLADTLEELHAMAKQIGMKREWYQPKSTPHYDLNLQRKSKALALGAIEVDNHKIVEIIRKYRQESDRKHDQV